MTEQKEKRSILKQAGSTASLACAVHCAVTPLLAAFLPAAGGGFGFSSFHGFEPYLVGFGVVLGFYFLLKAGKRAPYFKTRLALLIIGFVLFTLSQLLPENTLHFLLSFSGAMMVAGSQAAFLFKSPMKAHVHGPACGH